MTHNEQTTRILRQIIFKCTKCGGIKPKRSVSHLPYMDTNESGIFCIDHAPASILDVNYCSYCGAYHPKEMFVDHTCIIRREKEKRECTHCHSTYHLFEHGSAYSWNRSLKMQLEMSNIIGREVLCPKCVLDNALIYCAKCKTFHDTRKVKVLEGITYNGLPICPTANRTRMPEPV